MYLHRPTARAILCPPRTGSRSIRAAALAAGWEEHNGHHGLDDDAIAASTTRYVVVRNHFDALASWYTANRNTAYPTIGDWIRHWYPSEVDAGTGMGRYVRRGSYYGRWLDHATDVLRFEDYDDAFALLFGTDEQPRITDPKSVRGGRHYRALYSPEDRALVEDIFGAEIDALGYRW